MHDIAHFLRPGHLQQLRDILDDPEASANDRFVALDLLKNAAISAGGVLPMCQDTGTAIVKGKKGQFVFTGGGDERAIAQGVQDTYLTSNLRYSQMAPLNMYDERNTGTNLPAEIKIAATDGAEYKFLFMAKGGGSANKSYLFQETKALLNEATLLPWIFDKIQTLGTAACPPYHLGDRDRRHVGRVRARDRQARLGPLPRHAAHRRITARPRRSATSISRRKVLQLAQTTGIGAQFGGKYFCHDVRIVRLPRHGASCPVAIAVSCSADRQALGKITAEGVFLEELERDPARFLPETTHDDLDDTDVVHIDLTRPMSEIRAELSKYPVRTRVMLTGPMVVARDIAHAKIKERLDAGEPMPQYLQDHCVYYAGPAKTPEGYASGSFGPTTAGRMDAYVEQFQAAGGSFVMLAKGNRSKAVTDACRAARRLLPRLDRRAGGPARARQHQARRGARVPRARHGGGVEDRRRRLPGVHRRRRQGQRLLPAGQGRSRAQGDAGRPSLTTDDDRRLGAVVARRRHRRGGRRRVDAPDGCTGASPMHVVGDVADLEQQRELARTGCDERADDARWRCTTSSNSDSHTSGQFVRGGVLRGVATPRREHADRAVAHRHRALPVDRERGDVRLALARSRRGAVGVTEDDLDVQHCRSAADRARPPRSRAPPPSADPTTTGHAASVPVWPLALADRRVGILGSRQADQVEPVVAEVVDVAVGHQQHLGRRQLESRTRCRG